MFERIFTPVLAFMLLAGGTLAVGSELFAAKRVPSGARQLAVIGLPTVEVIGHRGVTPVAVTWAGISAAHPVRTHLE